jgi:hypothetical protein
MGNEIIDRNCPVLDISHPSSQYSILDTEYSITGFKIIFYGNNASNMSKY